MSSMVHFTFRDAKGYVEELSEEKVNGFIDDYKYKVRAARKRRGEHSGPVRSGILDWRQRVQSPLPMV